MKTLDVNLNKFTTNFRIGSFDTDYSGKAKITSICNYLQEIAGMHAEALHWGIEELQEQNLSWVLSRLKLKVFDYPMWKETITIETWPTGIDGLFGNRDFKILNENGETLMIATSSWLIINFKTKRPMRAGSVITSPDFVNEHLFETPLKKLTTNFEAEKEEKIKVHYSDIDINQHVNNVKYVKWILDSCPEEYLLHRKVDQLEINFLHEAKLNDNLYIQNGLMNDSSHQFVVRNQLNELENCRATIKWNTID